jgi:hypothetical protein
MMAEPEIREITKRTCTAGASAADRSDVMQAQIGDRLLDATDGTGSA